MKKIGAVKLYPFIYVVFIYCSVFLLSGVLSHTLDSNDSALDIKATSAFPENISSKSEPTISFHKNELEASSEGQANVNNVESTDKLDLVTQSVFAEVISQNLEVANEIINNDTPIVISLTDTATEELQEKANLPLSVTSQENLNHHEAQIGTLNASTTKTFIKIEEDGSDHNISTIETEDLNNKIDTPIHQNVSDQNAEDIPSFSEWAQKHLEEVEKKEQTNFSSPSQTVNTTKQGSGAKLRWKNYASVDCGAKVILANPEAQNTWSILSPSRDEYKLNPCNSRIWFIVELCEAIQIKKIDLANYELFSSSPKEFTVSVSDRFPTRDWSVVGQFTAKDERDVQSFDINHETFGKYVKIEIKSHYGSEHYCPLSLFRAYGTSVFEVLQKDDPAHEQPVEDDEDDETLDNNAKGETSGNLLSSATDAVLSMVKKAAQVLGNKVNKTSESGEEGSNTTSHTPMIKSCSSPSHYVVCNNCSDELFGNIFELLSCRPSQIKNLVSIPFIKKALVDSKICQRFGFDFKSKASQTTLNSYPECVESFFPPQYLGAMCNSLAVTYSKVLYNISYQFSNTTEKIHKEKWTDIDNEEQKVVPKNKLDSKENTEESILTHQPTEPLTIENSDLNSKSSCSTDTSYVSQIKPSKSFSTDLSINPEMKTDMASLEESKVDTGSSDHQQSIDLSIAEPTVIEASTELPIEVELVTESTEESIDKIITEINTDSNMPVSSSTPTTSANMQGQKESVFLRLSNRIKALERNMSLSGQYLEELSKRYKKQVEDMQRFLDKTVQSLNEVTQRQDERHRQLEDRIESLTTAVESLLSERNSWKLTSYWLFFAFALIFLVYCVNRYTAPKSIQASNPKPVEIQRRNSVDVVTRTTPKKKKRRPSDQALKIVAYAAAAGDQEKQSKKRKKKSSNPSDFVNGNNEDSGGNFSPTCTSSKIWSSKINTDWVEGRRKIEDIPFALDESDHSTLESLSIPPELNKIDAPSFIKTAANVRLGRSSFRNGVAGLNSKVKNLNEIKRRQPSPVISVNGSISSGTEQTPKKEKKGFKKLFKKVF